MRDAIDTFRLMWHQEVTAADVARAARTLQRLQGVHWTEADKTKVLEAANDRNYNPPELFPDLQQSIDDPSPEDE